MARINPDNEMVVAGVVLSLLAALELYPLWKAATDEQSTNTGRNSG
jgi:hypothetical protein